MSKKKAKEKKLVHTGKYTVELRQYDDGTYMVTRHNAGIHSLYLLGLLDMARRDIYDQITGTMPPPESVTRTMGPAETETP